MSKQPTAREINEKKWSEHWELMVAYLKDRLDDCMFLTDEHSIGISKDRLCFQIYGAEESFKFEDNTKVYIKATNKKTGKFVKVYEILKEERIAKRCSQSHLVHNFYSEDQLQFLKDVRDTVLDFYRPNSIKFITD